MKPGQVAYRRRSVQRAIYQSVFLVSLPFAILNFVLPIYGREIGADAVEIGMFFSACSFMIVLMRPIVGLAVDRYGRRPFFVTGLTGYALTMVVLALSKQVVGIIAARVIQGFSSAFLWLSIQAAVADVADSDDRAQAFGSINQVSSQGSTLGAVVGGVLLLSGSSITSNWAVLFLIYGTMGAFASWLAFRHFPETNPQKHLRSRQQEPIVWSRSWVLLLVVAGIAGASWAMVPPIIMIFLQDKLSAGLFEVALAFAPSALIWAMLPRKLGALSDRYGHKTLMTVALTFAALGLLLVPYLESLVGLTVVWAILALCFATSANAEQALVVLLTGKTQHGASFGIYKLAAGVGAIAGPLVSSLLYQHVDQAAPFIVNFLLLIACAVVIWRYTQVQP
jgi:MFS family permease